ncbi:sigma-B regulation protein RsbU (phosphoserine phosphatase) [Lewinella aquimaris]|uniref:Sigma-B regulation protein RsbU (Phosphoserine phosphatase) n=1 Tax=Neolewinella aquimaris TaxID=1835722 RepID=A0A840E4W4_9BACT|nr:GAF domain-containing SpoIIE family protein phosphatase [Neolewinella aquimaris]MBB4080110.1 sigma-B regulation protein RsbU (phosphoserine phosphatase) [Neolewinella aquimaris]
MAQPLTRINRLERELHLRQLQVRRLLQITQAINNNVSAGDLFQMYRSFLSSELGVNEMALFVRESEHDERWQLATSIGVDDLPTDLDYADELQRLKRPGNIDEPDHPLFRHFEHVVPVLHKERPIAFILIGSFTDEEDMFERVQIITTISNVIAVAIENKRLFRRQIEQERLEADLDLGAKVQQMLIPKELPTNDFYELSAIYRPKLGVGGDYFDYREFADGKLVFCIGDFTGKGVSAALLMANFQANFHTLIRKRTDLHAFVTEINESVYRITNGDRFVTFFVAEYDRSAHQLHYVNAGHPPAVLVSENGFQLLDKGTTVLGSIDELPVLEVGTVDLPPQALIVTYTDGLTDLQSAAGETFEEEILYQFARRQHYRSAGLFNENLLAKLEEFRQDNEYPDDLTILTCRIFGE